MHTKIKNLTIKIKVVTLFIMYSEKFLEELVIDSLNRVSKEHPI